MIGRIAEYIKKYLTYAINVCILYGIAAYVINGSVMSGGGVWIVETAEMQESVSLSAGAGVFAGGLL